MEIRKQAGICPVCKNRNHKFAPNTEGDICDSCQDKLAAHNSFVICRNCKRIAAVVKEGTTDNGFTFEAGKFYSTDRCARCSRVGELIINELEEFKNGR